MKKLAIALASVFVLASTTVALSESKDVLPELDYVYDNCVVSPADPVTGANGGPIPELEKCQNFTSSSEIEFDNRK